MPSNEPWGAAALIWILPGVEWTGRSARQTERLHGMGVGSLPQREREGKLDYLASSWCFSVSKNLQMRGPSWEVKFSPLQTIMCWVFFPHLNIRDDPVQILETLFFCSGWMHVGREKKLQDLNVGLVAVESVPYVCLCVCKHRLLFECDIWLSRSSHSRQNHSSTHFSSLRQIYCRTVFCSLQHTK